MNHVSKHAVGQAMLFAALILSLLSTHVSAQTVIASCRPGIVYLDATGSAIISDRDIDNGSINTAGGQPFFGVSPSYVTCTDLGTLGVTLYASDGTPQNTVTCSTTVNVEDTIAPTIQAQDINVYLDINGYTTLQGNEPDNGSTDNDYCHPLTFSVDYSFFDCSLIGTQVPVLFTATDYSGNSSSVWINVTVLDTVSPTVISAGYVFVPTNTDGIATVEGYQLDGGSYDNCTGPVTVVDGPFVFGCNQIGLNQITFTVADESGNTATGDAYVIVEDQSVPVAVCQDITVNLVGGIATITPNDVDAGSFAPCGGSLSYVLSQEQFDQSNLGANVVTLTVFGANSFGNSCVSAVTVVEDLNPPVAQCNFVTAELPASGTFELLVSDADAGSYDLEGGPLTYSLSQTTFDCTNIDNLGFYTLTVTDAAGNSSSCDNFVLLFDYTAPNTVCQNIDVNLDMFGSASISATDLDGGTTDNDNCHAISYSVDQSTFDCSTIGLNTVTLTATDYSGNSSSCTATVTVHDVTPPSPIGNYVPVSLDASGTATVDGWLLDGGSYDECGGPVTVISGPITVTCADIGFQSVVFTIADASGNTAQGTAYLDVTDNNPPSAFCQDFTLNLLGSTATLLPSDIDAGSFAPCGGTLTYVLSQSQFDASNIGPNSVTLTVFSPAGYGNSCYSTVTVVQSQDLPPVAQCNFVTAELPASGTFELLVSDADANSYDPEGGPLTYNLSQTTFDCTNIDNIGSYTLTVTDAAGNSSSCDNFVLLFDYTAPNTVCQNIDVNLDMFGSASISATDLDGGTTDNDNCHAISYSVDQSSFDCTNIGTNTVTLTATDYSGNSSSCSATVTVHDVTPPSPIGNYVPVSLDASGTATVDGWLLDGGSYDECGGPVTVISGPITVTCADIGFQSVVFTIADASGNTAQGTAYLDVTDNNPPSAFCQDFTLNLLGSTATLLPSDIDAGSFAPCGGTLTYVLSQSQFDASNIGPNSVTLTVFSPAGYGNSCYSTVTVVQSQDLPPVVQCNAVTAELPASGTFELLVSDADAGSYDPEGGPLTYSLSQTTFDCTNIDNIGSYTLTVTDAAGNSSSCDNFVLLFDYTAPNTVCQNIDVNLDMFGSASISATDLDGGTTDNDNCHAISYSVDQSSFDCTNIGTNTVTLTATDYSGNSSSCTATVTVIDNSAPGISCPSNITLPFNPSVNGATYTYTITANDNCGTPTLVRNVGLASGSVFPMGTTTVTHTATDAAGNSSSCSFVVTVIAASPLSANLSLSADTVQYSDQVTLTARIVNGAAMSAATGVSFSIGTQSVGTAAMMVSGADLVGTLTVPLLEPTPFGTAPTGQMAPGIRQVKAQFTGINPAVILTPQITDTLVITPENAQAVFSGTTFVYTSSYSSSNATVNLSATVMDNSSLPGSTDLQAGDIRNAMVTFVNRDNGNVIVADLPVSLVTSSDTRVGTVNYNWSTNIGSNNSESYTIGIIVTHYYVSDSSTADVVVTVSKPVSDFVTGGGYLVLSNSAGIKAGDAGTRNNFGFNVKYQRSGRRLYGKINTIFRRTEGGQLHSYQLKGNNFYTLTVDSTTGKFVFTGKGDVYDISDLNCGNNGNGNGNDDDDDDDDDDDHGNSSHSWSHRSNRVLSNASFRVVGTDRGEPGINDSLSITIYSGNSIYFTSRWSGTAAVEQKIARGNLVARCGNLNARQLEVDMNSTVGLEQNYPNPASTSTFITLQAAKDMRLALNIYDVDGRLVEALPEQEFLANTPYTIEVDVRSYSSGIYFYQVVGDGVNTSRKMWVSH